MALDRGALARIDRRVFAELAHDPGVQAVKVPMSDAMWSTWRRYCDAIGLTMGEGVAGLIAHELETVVNRDARYGWAERAARHSEERSSRLDARERELDSRDERLRAREAHLAGWQARIQEQLVSVAPVRRDAKVGRNQRCPCGSGLKYKRCHGP